MIEKLELVDFKCFKEETFSFKKINLIAGVNSSGKSTIWDAIRLFQKANSYKENVDGFLVESIFKKNLLYDDFLNINSDETTVEKFSIFVNDTSMISFPRVVPEQDYFLFEKDGEFDLNHDYNNFDARRSYNISDTYDDHIISDILYDISENEQLLLQIEDFLIKIFGIKEFSVNRYDLRSKTTYAYVDDIILQNCGYGIEFVIPILHTCLKSTDIIVIIENPELHLHPRAQSLLIKNLIDIANVRNIQLFIETHSEHVINAFRKVNVISGIDVGVYYFDNNYRVKQVSFEKDKIINPPKGFMDQTVMDIMEIWENENTSK